MAHAIQPFFEHTHYISFNSLPAKQQWQVQEDY